MNKLKNFLLLDDIFIDNRNIKVVRDDVFPFIGGGSKARKAIFYESFLQEQGYNAVVTCGGIQSNHNRAIALMAAKNGWKCHLCIQGSQERFYSENGNALLNRLSGAECEMIRPENTSHAMDRAMDSFKKRGMNPYYIHGGGHDLPGGIAFVEAVKELKSQCDAIEYKPKYIFHASGTGSTQAGIAVGLDMFGWHDVTLIGISVARQFERGNLVIEEFANLLSQYYGLSTDYRNCINFCTDYLCGGYENFTSEMKVYLDYAMCQTGLMFDTTYSGKAFYGMMDIVKKNNINEPVMFWHTGGLMNIQK